jgi:hypothetical protein
VTSQIRRDGGGRGGREAQFDRRRPRARSRAGKSRAENASVICVRAARGRGSHRGQSLVLVFGSMPMKLIVPTSAGRAALEDLSRVDWSSLGHAYTGGSNASVPSDDVLNILESFYSEDAEARQDAYHETLNSVCHQGSICELTPVVIPFLAAFVADPGTPCRGRLLSALVLIAESAVPGGAEDPVAEGARRAFAAARQWLSLAAEQGPELSRRAVQSIEARLAGDAAEGDPLEIATELERWADQEDAASEPEETDAEIAAELRRHAETVRDAPYKAQSGALGRAEFFLRRAPRLVLAVAEACNHGDVEVRRRLLRLRALALTGAVDEPAEELRRLVLEWLGPAKLGAVNQCITRKDLLRVLDEFPLVDADLRKRLQEAPEPGLALPEGDTF